MSICYRLRLIHAQKKGNYKTICNNKITVRVERRKTKTESFRSQKQKQKISLCTVIFAMIAKIRYDSENFAMHSNFRYDSENSL